MTRSAKLLGTPSPLHEVIGETPAGEAQLDGARLLILFPHLTSPGGAMTYTLKLAEMLAGRGATVAILTLRADPAKYLAPAGVEILSLQGPLTSSLSYWGLLPFWQLRLNSRIAAWRPDVIVPQVFPANWWGWLYKLTHRDSRLIWICHEPSAFIHSHEWIRALRPLWKSMLALALRPFLAAIDVALARNCDRIVANSRFTASEMRRVYGVSPDAIAYPGIELSAYSGATGPKGRDILTVARLTGFKRIDFLLEVFARVLKVYPDLLFHIVGTGEDEELLRKRAQGLGITSSVLFHGSVDDPTLASLYRRSAIFLHGAVGEPFGMAPMEAIAWGTPVVAHRSGGPMEFVTESCGRLVDSLEVAEWASEITDYLALLWAQEGYRDQVRTSARDFDWSSTLKPAVRAIAALCAGGDGEKR